MAVKYSRISRRSSILFTMVERTMFLLIVFLIVLAIAYLLFGIAASELWGPTID
jgi:hypothetical protein